MSRELTVDTNVLYAVAQLKEEELALILKIKLQDELVALDHAGHIECEYRSCVKRCQKSGHRGVELLQQWVTVIIAKKAIKREGTLSANDQAKMIALDCKEKDWPFIGVCSRTVDRILVTYDAKHFNNQVCDYLLKKHGISVMTAKGACK